MKIIVGLGNPGLQYENSRHNIGFLVVDQIAKANHIVLCMRHPKILYGLGWIGSERIILLKPTTYMNRSGEAVLKAVRLFGSRIEDLITIHDDLDLPFGKLRFKRRGGDGGHQGVRSLIDSLGGDNFWRLKVGIGRPPKGVEPAHYVLEPFDGAEQSQLDEILPRAAEALTVALTEGVDQAMNRYQRKAETTK